MAQSRTKENGIEQMPDIRFASVCYHFLLLEEFKRKGLSNNWALTATTVHAELCRSKQGHSAEEEPPPS